MLSKKSCPYGFQRQFGQLTFCLHLHLSPDLDTVVVVAMLVLSACAWIPSSYNASWLEIVWNGGFGNCMDIMASELMNGASSIQALVMLTATIVLLSVITYLTQSREQDIMESS